MSFHIFHVNEVYSNADGTVQFIEFVGDANLQHEWAGHTLTSTNGVATNTYNFLTDLPSSATAGESVLVATQGFADLGIVTPDYIIPNGFLFINNGTVTFPGMDSISYVALPTDGTTSLNGSGIAGTNSPKNFARATGTIPAAPSGDEITGTDGPDSLPGTPGDDTISGGAGNDTLDGGQGNDLLTGGDGDDSVAGGAGNDTISVDVGNDTVAGGDGSDVFDVSLVTTDRLFQITGFAVGSGGDVISLASIAAASTGLSPSDNPFDPTLGFARLVFVLDFGLYLGLSQSGLGTVLQWDPDGAAGPADWKHQLILRDVFPTSSDNLLLGPGASLDVITTERVPAGGGASGGEGITQTVVAAINYSLANLGSIEGLVLVRSATQGTGNALDNSLTGNELSNVLDGQGGADVIFGHAGNDILFGADGNDTLVGGNGNDTLDGGAGTDTVDYSGSPAAVNVNLVTGLAQDGYGRTDRLIGIEHVAGSNFNDAVEGGAGDDTLAGGDGADTIVGGAGTDSLRGGEGDDIFLFGSFAEHGAAEIILGDNGNDVIRFTGTTAGTLTLSPNVGIDGVVIGNAAGSTTGTTAIHVDASALSGVLVIGGTVVTNDGVSLIGNNGMNWLNGTVLDDEIAGNGGNDSVVGEAGNDTLNGGPGADTMAGGDGNDTYVVDSTLDRIVEGDPDDVDGVQSSVTFTLAGTNLEHLALTGLGAINGAGNDTNNAITGNSGANRLEGGAGEDTLIGNGGPDTLTGGVGNDSLVGGTGNDTYVVDDAGDEVVESSTTATELDTIRSTVGLDLTARGWMNIENVTLMGAAAGDLTGNARINTLIGNEGANTLDGLAGADILKGGKGDDTYIVSLRNPTATTVAPEDTVAELLNEGTDTLEIRVPEGLFIPAAGSTVLLGANVESLRLYSTAAGGGIDDVSWLLNATGNTARNRIDGNGGANRLDGGAGNDTLIGGAGNDTLLGSAGNDILDGGAGDDTLDAGLGSDSLIGGADNDVYILDVATDAVIEAADEGSDAVRLLYSVAAPITIDLGIAYGGNVENVRVLGTGAFTLMGNAAANYLAGNASPNTLNGGAGNDTLDGGPGNDTMAGGDGNDTYVVNSTLDRIVEDDVDDTDVVRSSVVFSLNAAGHENLEHLTLTGIAAVNGTGNALANTLTGNSAANRLEGREGWDVLIGGQGNDTLDGGTGGDQMDGGAGNDTYIVDDPDDEFVGIESSLASEIDLVRSSINWSLGQNLENLTLTGTDPINATGNDRANTLIGNEGANLLDGEGGADILRGGKGDDTYIVNLRNPTVTTVALEDTLTEALNEGTDTLEVLRNGVTLPAAGFTVVLGANVENLRLYDSAGAIDDVVAALHGTGNAGKNWMEGNGGANRLDGGADSDTLIGGSGNDTLIGGLGTDSLIGGGGNDFYLLDSLSDVVTEDADAGSDWVHLTSSVAGTYELPDHVDNILLLGTAAVSATGNDLVNHLKGNSANNQMSGGGGNDTLMGTGGNDTLDGGEADDVLEGGAGVDSLTGGAGDDTFWLQFAADFASGEKVDGGAGNDTLRYAGTTATTLLLNNVVNVEQVVVAQGPSIGTIAVNVNAAAVITNGMTITGNDGANALTGSGLDDVLVGNGGNDSLLGGAGADSLEGGAGADTLVGGDGVDTLMGGGANDILIWDAADDIIDGGVDVDTLIVSGSANTLDLTGLGGVLVSDVEVINLNLASATNNTLTLGVADVLAMSSSTDILRIDGNAGDVVNAGSGWADGGVAGGYHTWTQGLATLLVDTDIAQNIS